MIELDLVKFKQGIYRSIYMYVIRDHRTVFAPVRLVRRFQKNELFALFAQCELFALFAVRTVRIIRTVRTVRCSHCSHVSNCSSFALFAQCELFALFEQFTRFAVRTVRYFRKKVLFAVQARLFVVRWSLPYNPSVLW